MALFLGNSIISPSIITEKESATNINIKIDFNNPIALWNNANYLIHNNNIQVYTEDIDVLNPLSLDNNFVQQFVHDGNYELDTSNNLISSVANEGSVTSINFYETNIVYLLEITYTTNCGFSNILHGTNWSLDWGSSPHWSKPYSSTAQTYIIGGYLLNGQNTIGIQFGQSDSSLAGTVKISKLHKFKLP